MNEPTFAQEIDTLIEAIITAERYIYAEGLVDLNGLDAKVVDLCERLKKAPPQTTKPLVKKVETLLNALERLERDLDLQHDGITRHKQLSEDRANPLWAQEVPESEEE